MNSNCNLLGQQTKKTPSKPNKKGNKNANVVKLKCSFMIMSWKKLELWNIHTYNKKLKITLSNFKEIPENPTFLMELFLINSRTKNY